MEMATERVQAQSDLESQRPASVMPAPQMSQEQLFATPLAMAMAPGNGTTIQRSSRLLASPVFRSAGGRALVMRQVQQGYGNRFAQRLMRHHSAVIQRQCACGGTCAECQRAGAMAASLETHAIQ